MKTVLYPGSFDPITYGHMDIIQRAIRIFDRLIVTVACDVGSKQATFTVEERVEMIKACTEQWDVVTVTSFKGLLVNYVHACNVHTVIRGLRAVMDFEYEFQMALTNRSLDPDFECVYLMPSKEYTYFSSTVAKEIARLDGDVSLFVHPYVEQTLKERFRSDRIEHR